jgi:hypothetical protein
VKLRVAGAVHAPRRAFVVLVGVAVLAVGDRSPRRQAAASPRPACIGRWCARRWAPDDRKVAHGHHCRRECEQRRRRLEANYIDLYQGLWPPTGLWMSTEVSRIPPDLVHAAKARVSRTRAGRSCMRQTPERRGDVMSVPGAYAASPLRTGAGQERLAKAGTSETWHGRAEFVAASGRVPGEDAHAYACDQVAWAVTVQPYNRSISRTVTQSEARGGNDTRNWKKWPKHDGDWAPETTIWPAFVPSDARSELSRGTPSPLGSVEDYWLTAANRIRESAKWMAAVLGAALATLIGTSPLVSLKDKPPRGLAWVLGALGLLALAVTLFLLLQVLRPQTTSYVDIQRARGPSAAYASRRRGRAQDGGETSWARHCRYWHDPLAEWKDLVESEQDLYLPSGVKCLTTLRQMTIIEELTMMALSNAMAHRQATKEDQRNLIEAQEICAARLGEWRMAGSRIASIGEFYRLHRRSGIATYLGSALGLLGTVLVIAAFMLHSEQKSSAPSEAAAASRQALSAYVVDVAAIQPTGFAS